MIMRCRTKYEGHQGRDHSRRLWTLNEREEVNVLLPEFSYMLNRVFLNEMALYFLTNTLHGPSISGERNILVFS